jgi:hypothetical protein
MTATDENLRRLKQMTMEEDAAIKPECDGCTECQGAPAICERAFSDEQLKVYLEMSETIERAAYAVLLRKAKNSEVTFPSGIKLPDQSEYYLRIARTYRTSRTRTLARADDI